jgi:transcriptional regulator with XRE-family HTH domain
MDPRETGIARQLRAARLAQGWSQREMSRRSGVSQANISVVESGQGDPRLSTLSAIASALGLTLVLIDRTSAPYRAPPKSGPVQSVLQEVVVPDPEEGAEE